jgi:hypothetical protein
VIDTTALESSVSFVTVTERTVAIAPEPIKEPPPPLQETVKEPPPPPVQETEDSRPPFAKNNQPVGDPVVDVAVTPAALNPPSPPAPVSQPVRPAVGSVPAVPSYSVHGALKQGQSIVYLLDASGSMGEWGKFAAARRALLATLREQPETVRVQVIVYGGSARSIVPGGYVAATRTNVARIEEGLSKWEPAGRSEHAVGLRVALQQQPDFVLVLTDAEDLSAAKLRGVLIQADKPATICVAKVSAEGVSAPRELK